MKNFKALLVAIIIIIIFTALSALLTIDIIKETGDWQTLDIDFTGQADAISAYAALLGGVLLFLSILFILIQLFDQRRKENLQKENEYKKEIQSYRNRLEITSTFIDQIKEDILKQGNKFIEYYKKENENPTLMNQCYFIINKDSETLLNLNTEITYQAFQWFQPTNDWKKAFLNLNKEMHFYSELLPHLRENYHQHINDKVSLKRHIQESIHDFLQDISDIHNNLVAEYRKSGDSNLVQVLDFFEDFRKKYNEQLNLDKKNGDSDLSLYKQKLYKPFTEDASAIINDHSYFTKMLSPIIQQMGRIIDDVGRLEALALNYSVDLKKQIDNYFVSKENSLKVLVEIKKGIDISLKKQV